jgi:hypothetical protein
MRTPGANNRGLFETVASRIAALLVENRGEGGSGFRFVYQIHGPAGASYGVVGLSGSKRQARLVLELFRGFVRGLQKREVRITALAYRAEVFVFL